MWKMILGGGWMAIPCVIATISIMNLVAVKPKIKKLEAAEAENMVQYTQLKTFEQEVLDYDRTVKAQRAKMAEDSVNYASLTAQKQNLIIGMNNTIKSKDALIGNLQTGIQVDVKTYWIKKKLFGGEEIVDSTYQEAVRYGSLVGL